MSNLLPIIKKIVQLDQKDFDLAKDFANTHAKHHKDKGHKSRTDDIRHQDVYVGKLGEIAFSKMFDPFLAVSFKGTVDDGWDFVVGDPPIKVDVKTTDSFAKTKIYVNQTYLRADIYANVLLDELHKVAFYSGSVDKYSLMKNLIEDDRGGSYVLRTLFK